ncbi:phospholipase [Actinomycetospora endophytica]|uniref:Phospholipase n=1 Tax=Actinomycetospora endophytica TaxID=2291215 RepID=A0ABS8P114_9PSEU|nr:alkaline phosphatase family protein [Actinomycetospora endophytica]MCD2191940.1 phospholipase [Actinomycetospora endophytica]
MSGIVAGIIPATGYRSYYTTITTVVEMGRRRVLGGSAAAAAVAAVALLPERLQRVAVTPTGHSVADVEHVVLMMMENRSFDHYFGAMPGVRGFGDPRPQRLPGSSRTVFQQPLPAHPDGYVMPFHLDSSRTSAQAIRSLNHSWEAEHGYWANGRMDGFLTYEARRSVLSTLGHPGPVPERREYAMGYFTRDDVPFHHGLAENFTICDNYFCSVMGSTWPNRLMWMTGTMDPEGRAGGPVYDTGDASAEAGRLNWTTYPERLERAGVSWRAYDEERGTGLNPLEEFRQFRTATTGSPLARKGLGGGGPGEFERDVAAGRLPTVSWVFPRASESEHPMYRPADGAAAIARKLGALAAHPEVWAKTVFILNYDENDGLFDHVSPPVPPVGTPDEYADGEHVGPGFRVPCLVISPWSTGGWVSSELLDHTSILRFLEHVTGVQEPNISAWRRSTFGDLRSTLALDAPPRTSPNPLTRLPDAAGIARRVDDDLLSRRLADPQVPEPQRMPLVPAAPRPRFV